MNEMEWLDIIEYCLFLKKEIICSLNCLDIFQLFSNKHPYLRLDSNKKSCKFNGISYLNTIFFSIQLFCSLKLLSLPKCK